MKITKMLCIALCALIWLCAGAQAAPDMNMADIRVQLDGAEYAFPMRDADCGEMTLPDVLPEAGCYAIADADDGTNTFRVRVDHCEGEAWLTGFEVNARNAGAKAGALTIGETTRKAALEIMGEAVHATEIRWNLPMGLTIIAGRSPSAARATMRCWWASPHTAR